MDTLLELPLAGPHGTAAPLPGPRRTAARHAAATRAPATPPGKANGPRLGELLAALSQSFDLAEGQPAGHGLRTCWIAQRLGRTLGLDAIEMRALYCATLLKDAGGSANAARLSRLLQADDLAFKRATRLAGDGAVRLAKLFVRHAGPGGGLTSRLRTATHLLRHGDGIAHELAEARSVRGAQVARELGFGDDVAEAVQCLDEHWDGNGRPQGLRGREIPLPARIAAVAQAAEVFHASAGASAARTQAARRAGRRFDPKIASAFDVLARDPGFWRQLAADDLDDQVRALEPARQPQPVDDEFLDAVAHVVGAAADAKSAFTAGHSGRVALVADRLCATLGLDEPLRRWLRRGALMHDLGKLGVSSAILDKPGPLDPWEWAATQRHAASTEQILGRVSAFGVLARVAGAHHEKLDGSGYPRGLDARHIRLETRIITTADIFDALTAERAHRPALAADAALARMRAMVGVAIDGDCLEALVASLA